MKKLIIAGVDEAGRGPLAGPVIAGAVILNPERPIQGLMDSKKLSEKRRDELYDQIIQHSLAWAVGRASVEEIDEINILQASLLAMRRAVMALSIAPDSALIDGNFCPKLNCKAQAIIRGDQTEPTISAASIIAKVTRDREMILLDKKYPSYGFAKHKGYGTAAHLKAIKSLGACEIHRRSFSPVAKVLGLVEV